MNKNIINKLIITAFIASFALTATNTMAGQDFFQQQMTQRILKDKQKLQQAEAAKGVERQTLLDEHMQMLHETMRQCREMKPKVGMSGKERDEWYAEHQKLMDQMMDQMVEEHHVIMASAPCETNKK